MLLVNDLIDLNDKWYPHAFVADVRPARGAHAVATTTPLRLKEPAVRRLCPVVCTPFVPTVALRDTCDPLPPARSGGFRQVLLLVRSPRRPQGDNYRPGVMTSQGVGAWVSSLIAFM